MELVQKVGIVGGKFSVHVTENDELIFSKEKLFNKNTSKYLLEHIDPLYER